MSEAGCSSSVRRGEGRCSHKTSSPCGPSAHVLKSCPAYDPRHRTQKFENARLCIRARMVEGKCERGLCHCYLQPHRGRRLRRDNTSTFPERTDSNFFSAGWGRCSFTDIVESRIWLL